MSRVALAGVLVCILVVSSGCVKVPAKNRRAKLADPMMNVSDPPLEAAQRQKLYTTREGAAGGDGAAAGGGCGCQ